MYQSFRNQHRDCFRFYFFLPGLKVVIIWKACEVCFRVNIWNHCEAIVVLIVVSLVSQLRSVFGFKFNEDNMIHCKSVYSDIMPPHLNPVAPVLTGGGRCVN